jgi:hypothetical protein
MIMIASRLVCVATVAFAVLAVTPVQAVQYDLTIDHCTGGCSTGVSPFGSVTVTQDGANLDFTVSLNSPYAFNKSTGLDAFVFGVSGGASSDITNVASGFSVDTTLPQHEDGFGDFLFGITKAATGGQLLTFTFANAVLADLVLSTGGSPPVLFAADITGNGDTGPVGTPLPGALALFAPVLGAGYFALRRRRRAAAPATA